MKLNLQYTSHLDKEHIKEAAKLKDGEDAMLNGWDHIGSGVFKKAYKKGNVVVKFNNQQPSHNMHMLREVVLYKDAHRKYKRHLARIFGGNGEKIIQKFLDYDKHCPFNKEDKDKMRKIGVALGISDYFPGTNVVKTKDNTVVFYDFSGHSLTNI